MTDLKLLCRRVIAAGTLGLAAAHLFAQTGDYIVVVVNQELVTASEVQQRVARLRDEATRNKATLPPLPTLRKQVLEALIDERVMVTNARETGSVSTTPRSTVPSSTWRPRIR
jgi:NAD(P)-dependent dehydrogenase (short-subunit alcohol dehydrogenase family)